MNFLVKAVYSTNKTALLKKGSPMKSGKNIFMILLFINATLEAKRPPKPPKEPKKPLSAEQKQAIAAGAAQLMSGVLTIVQDPHNKHNVGNSIGAIIQGIINILVERIGNRGINNDDKYTMQYIEEIYQEFGNQINEIIITKGLKTIAME